MSQPSYEDLLKENKMLKERVKVMSSSSPGHLPLHGGVDFFKGKDVDGKSQDWSKEVLSIIVLGASGDLAKKKTFPALFSLFCHGLLPTNFVVAGYARSAMEVEAFQTHISAHFPKNKLDQKQAFLDRCFYFAGKYDSLEDFGKFREALEQHEKACLADSPANRVFYLAIPPNIFVDVAKSVRGAAMTQTGFNRVIVEKPFGRDSESSAELGRALAALYNEDQLYRIDHYLGKEMVQNLMVLRFANKVFEPLWNSYHISTVTITFKEDFGTQGRGGYFDNFGMIRDVMQNHLLQILSLIAMEPPVTLSAEDVRDEKVKLLRAIAPLRLEDLVIGQYGAHPEGKEPAYLDDKTVPKDSVTPTFACAVLNINNARWKGTPFVLKCGKALNERKAEIRIQFSAPKNELFEEFSPNELVLRVQPDEAVYLKMTTKKPGLVGGLMHTELNLSYKTRFEEAKNLPDAYERLILDVIRGDHNLFVRDDELEAAWRIFTPVLHRIENERIRPIVYPYGSRGPAEADELISRCGYVRTTKYTWSDASSKL